MQLNSSRRLMFTIGRYVLYSAFIGLMIAWLMERAAIEAEDESFKEGSAVEWIQFALASVTMLVLALGGWWARRGRWWLLAGACLAAVALVRELDYLFDAWLPLLGWAPFAGALLVGAGACMWRATHQADEPDDEDDLLATPAIGVLWGGWLVVVVVAQIAGQAEPWQAVMADGYTRNLKRTVEELIEAVGYMLLWAGSVELVVEAVWPVDRRRPTEPDAGH